MTRSLSAVAIFALLWGFVAGCSAPSQIPSEESTPVDIEPSPAAAEPEFTLNAVETHSRFSRLIEPRLRVPSGAIVEIHTKEASDGQFHPDSVAADVLALDFDPIHPLSGPIYVEGAQAGDVLKVVLHEIHVGDWGWTAITPGFSFLADEFVEPAIKTFRIPSGATHVDFSEGVRVPLRPFAGVMGVASGYR